MNLCVGWPTVVFVSTFEKVILAVARNAFCGIFIASNQFQQDCRLVDFDAPWCFVLPQSAVFLTCHVFEGESSGVQVQSHGNSSHFNFNHKTFISVCY